MMALPYTPIMEEEEDAEIQSERQFNLSMRSNISRLLRHSNYEEDEVDGRENEFDDEDSEESFKDTDDEGRQHWARD